MRVPLKAVKHTRYSRNSYIHTCNNCVPESNGIKENKRKDIKKKEINKPIKMLAFVLIIRSSTYARPVVSSIVPSFFFSFFFSLH